LLALPGGEYGFLIVVTIIVFILGCFLDFFEIAFIMVPLLAPVADKLGIDLVWFGIILGINLQTSFLTPPFGFSLFFLRSIAPAGTWVDKVTGKSMPGVKTTEIYKGVFPYIVIQFIMIMVIIAFPGLVMHYKGDAPKTDPANIQIEMPGFGTPGQAPGGGSNPFGLPPINPGGGSAPAPQMGLPPLSLGGDAPAAGSAPAAPAAPSFGLPALDGLPGQQPAAPAPAPAPQPDLTQPPKF
jgi:Tripartite ATP-independent periplasmic transporter, DctM component